MIALLFETQNLDRTKSAKTCTKKYNVYGHYSGLTRFNFMFHQLISFSTHQAPAYRAALEPEAKSQSSNVELYLGEFHKAFCRAICPPLFTT